MRQDDNLNLLRLSSTWSPIYLERLEETLRGGMSIIIIYSRDEAQSVQHALISKFKSSEASSLDPTRVRLAPTPLLTIFFSLE